MALTELKIPPGAVETLGDGIGFVACVDRMQVDHALKVVNSARISYEKQRSAFDERDRKLCGFLWEHGHTSPYRHSYYTFHWKAPLFVFRQAFKYQVGSGWREYSVEGVEVALEVFDVLFDTDKGCSWNEVSGRYVQWTPEFYAPRTFRGNPPHGNKQASVDLPGEFDHAAEHELMVEECREAYRRYEARIQRGVAKEIARMCLPQTLYSQAYWTVSLQGVLHFLEQRLKPDAQHEIRAYASAVHSLVRDDLERVGVDASRLGGGAG